MVREYLDLAVRNLAVPRRHFQSTYAGSRLPDLRGRWRAGVVFTPASQDALVALAEELGDNFLAVACGNSPDHIRVGLQRLVLGARAVTHQLQVMAASQSRSQWHLRNLGKVFSEAVDSGNDCLGPAVSGDRRDSARNWRSACLAVGFKR